MYCTAMKKHVIESTDYKICLQLLKFLSKADLLDKFDKVCFMNINVYSYECTVKHSL